MTIHIKLMINKNRNTFYRKKTNQNKIEILVSDDFHKLDLPLDSNNKMIDFNNIIIKNNS